MSLLIEADAAIAAVEWGITYATLINVETGEMTHPFDAINEELKKAVERIKKLPTVEMKRGRWLMVAQSAYACSECGCFRNHAANFCEACGAIMEGGGRMQEAIDEFNRHWLPTQPCRLERGGAKMEGGETDD